MPRSRSVVLPARALLALLLAIAVPVVLAVPAAATAYRYWGYFQLDNGSWTFAQTGPAQSKPADGSVEGWRYAVGTESDTREPRATPSFEDLCGTTPAASDKARIGVVVDYGRPADAADGGAAPPEPRGACAVVPTGSSGADVLAAVATVRSAGGLTCALDGYPATGCGDQVATVPPAAASPDVPVTLAGVGPTATATAAAASGAATGENDGGGGGLPVAGWVAIGAVVAAVAAGLATRRRRGVEGAE